MLTVARRKKRATLSEPRYGGMAILIGTQLQIPEWVRDHESFRRWARSPDCPEKGRFSFYDGDLRVDTEMEQLYIHNQIKSKVSLILTPLVEESNLGLYVSDGMLLSNADVGLSTIPDGYYVSFEAFKSERVREVAGKVKGCVELVGTPEMVLEVVSDSSETKDLVDLRSLYWEAGVAEYWIIDAREEEVNFQILRRNGKGFTPVKRSANGWLRSEVFQKSFHLIHSTNPVGKPRYNLEMK